MKAIYEALEARLTKVDGIKSVSIYNGSVKELEQSLGFPAALVLFDNVTYQDGLNGYQVGNYRMVIYLLMKGVHKNVMEALDLVDRVSKALHMHQLDINCSPMVRESETMPDVFTDLFVFEQAYRLTRVDYGVVEQQSSASLALELTVSHQTN